MAAAGRIPCARRGIVAACVLLAACTAAMSAEPAVNYEEAAVGRYTLPDPLAGPDGTRATSVAAWRDTVRPRQFALLEKHLFGRRLPAVDVTAVGPVERTAVALAGDRPAVRLQARLRMGDARDLVDVLLYLPRVDQPVPLFLGLNFHGNQAEHPDPDIRLCTSWLADVPAAGIVGNRAGETSRGICAQRWPVERMLERGYGMATACYCDFFPDRPDGRAASMLPSLGRPGGDDLPDDEPVRSASGPGGCRGFSTGCGRSPKSIATG